jgi:hypothetical protein
MTRAQPKTPAPADLSVEERKRLLGWVRAKARPVNRPPDLFFKRLLADNKKILRYHIDACLEWHQSKGVGCHDWVMAVQKWIGKAAIAAAERSMTEKPQMTAGRGRAPSPLTDLLAELETREMFEGDK